MSMHWPALLGAAALAGLIGVAAPALAQEEQAAPAKGDVNSWDSDGSGSLDVEEWSAGYGESSVWDSNGDDRLSDREFAQGLFDTYDVDNDGQLDEDERQAFQDDADERSWLDM